MDRPTDEERQSYIQQMGDLSDTDMWAVAFEREARVFKLPPFFDRHVWFVAVQRLQPDERRQLSDKSVTGGAKGMEADEDGNPVWDKRDSTLVMDTDESRAWMYQCECMITDYCLPRIEKGEIKERVRLESGKRPGHFDKDHDAKTYLHIPTELAFLIQGIFDLVNGKPGTPAAEAWDEVKKEYGLSPEDTSPPTDDSP